MACKTPLIALQIYVFPVCSGSRCPFNTVFKRVFEVLPSRRARMRSEFAYQRQINKMLLPRILGVFLGPL